MRSPIWSGMRIAASPAGTRSPSPAGRVRTRRSNLGRFAKSRQRIDQRASSVSTSVPYCRSPLLPAVLRFVSYNTILRFDVLRSGDRGSSYDYGVPQSATPGPAVLKKRLGEELRALRLAADVT